MSTLSTVVSLSSLLMLYIYLGLGPSLLRISHEDHLIQMPIQLPADANLSSPQIKLVNDWSEGFLEMNVEILGKPLHKDFRRLVYPRSLGEPEQNKEEWLKEITGIIGFGIGSVSHATCYLNLLSPQLNLPLQTTTHSIIEAPGRVVTHVRILILFRLTSASTSCVFIR